MIFSIQHFWLQCVELQKAVIQATHLCRKQNKLKQTLFFQTIMLCIYLLSWGALSSSIVLYYVGFKVDWQRKPIIRDWCTAYLDTQLRCSCIAPRPHTIGGISYDPTQLVKHFDTVAVNRRSTAKLPPAALFAVAVMLYTPIDIDPSITGGVGVAQSTATV